MFDNATATFTANIGNSKEITGYQWYYNGSAIDGATSNEYKLSTSQMDDSNYTTGGKYKVKVTNSAGSSATSSEATLTVQYSISNKGQLQNFATRVNSGIDFSGKTVTLANTISSLGNLTPIGTATNRFKGTFDGGGNTLAELTISSSNQYVGIFGCIENATIKNLTTNGTITSTYSGSSGYTGGIVAWGKNVTIESCTNAAKVTANYQDTGGIIGIAANTSIDKCTNAGNISNGRYMGGISGMHTSGQITSCINTGTISANRGSTYIGGITGNFGGTEISECGNNGVITSNAGTTAGNVLAGGLVAQQQGDGCVIELCYNKGNVSAVGNETVYASGIVARVATHANQAIHNCYNQGSISGSQKTGDANGYVSGIANTLVTFTMDNTYSRGKITSSNKNGWQYAAGIVTISDGTDNPTTTNQLNIDKSYYLQSNMESESELGIWGKQGAKITASGTTKSLDLQGYIDHGTGTIEDHSNLITFLGTTNWKAVSGGYPKLIWEN